MSHDSGEREFMGNSRSRVWTYLILMVALVAIAIVINVVWNDPARARDGMKHFLGLPSYLLALILFLIGSVVFWLGLKMETDWPEAFGAFLIAGAVGWLEMIVGWSKFDVGGLVVLPYLIPIALFALLLMYGMKRSV